MDEQYNIVMNHSNKLYVDILIIVLSNTIKRW